MFKLWYLRMNAKEINAEAFKNASARYRYVRKYRTAWVTYSYKSGNHVWNIINDR